MNEQALWLDGNALAGLLEELFATELTDPPRNCGSCGADQGRRRPSPLRQHADRRRRAARRPIGPSYRAVTQRCCGGPAPAASWGP
jgi:hypothetical protein